jgi:hypothetical protein
MASGLDRQAREFASQVSGLLNKTVCDGLRIACVELEPDRASVAYGLTRGEFRPQSFPTRDSRCWLRVAYSLSLDDRGEHLTVTSSAFGVYADAEARRCLCRWDYERGKLGYPEAHLQVYGESDVLAQWPSADSRDHDDDCQPDCQLVHDGEPFRQMARLHLPAGDRRYRPTLEDVVEFLVTEQLASPRQGWRQAVDEGRGRWRRIQLSAAVRRDPDTARTALARVDAEAMASRRPRRGG